MMKRAILNKVLGLILLIPLASFAAPQIEATGGRYTLSMAGEMEEGYYNQNYKALKAAVNLSLTCGCSVVVHQPSITISVNAEVETTPDAGQETTNITTVSWSIPTERENGSSLTIDEIAGYEVVMSREGRAPIISTVSGGSTTEYVVSGLDQGLYQFQVRTVDKDGLQSVLSNKNSKQID